MCSNLKVLFPGNHYYDSPLNLLDTWRLSNDQRRLEQESLQMQARVHSFFSMKLYKRNQDFFSVNYRRRSRNAFLFLIARELKVIINDKGARYVKVPSYFKLTQTNGVYTYYVGKETVVKEVFLTHLQEALNIQFLL